MTMVDYALLRTENPILRGWLAERVAIRAAVNGRTMAAYILRSRQVGLTACVERAQDLHAAGRVTSAAVLEALLNAASEPFWPAAGSPWWHLKVAEANPSRVLPGAL